MSGDLTEGPSRLGYLTARVPEELRDEIVAELAELGLEWDEFAVHLGQRLCRQVDLYYREAFLDVLRKTRGADFLVIQERLQKSDSQRWKWERKDPPIGWETITEAMAAFDVVLSDGLVPAGRMVVCIAAQAAVRLVGESELQLGQGEFGFREWLCLIETEKLYWKNAETATIDRDRKRERAAWQVRRVVKTYTGLVVEWDFDAIMAIRRRWWKPWVLFHAAVPHHWEF